MEEAKMKLGLVLQEYGWTAKQTGPGMIEASRDNDGQLAVFNFEVIDSHPKFVPGENGKPDTLSLPTDPNFMGLVVYIDWLDHEGNVVASTDQFRLDGGYHERMFISDLKEGGLLDVV